MPAVGSMDALDNSEIIEPHGSRTQAHRQPSSCEADGHEEAQLPSLPKSSREVGPAPRRPPPLPEALVLCQLDGVFGALRQLQVVDNTLLQASSDSHPHIAFKYHVEEMISDIEQAFEKVFTAPSTPSARPANTDISDEEAELRIPQAECPQEAGLRADCLWLAATEAGAGVLLNTRGKPETNAVTVKTRTLCAMKSKWHRWIKKWDRCCPSKGYEVFSKLTPDESDESHFKRYIESAGRQGAWAGCLELACLCDTYKVRTIVGTATSRFRVGQDAAKEMKDLWYTGSHYDWCQHPLPERELFIIADGKEMRGGAMRGGAGAHYDGCRLLGFAQPLLISEKSTKK